MGAVIHPTAFVDPQAELGANVRVGPFCHVGAGVVLGDDCELISHVTVLGPSRFGARNRFFPNCVIGADPQDLKYRGGPTGLFVGDDNTFREFVTIHRGTEVDQASGAATRIGNQNLFMVNVHVAHDCELGDHIILANAVLLAGHVKIESCVNVGGASAMHHFVTVGRNAFIAGMTRITHDAPPYMKIEGYDQAVRGVNSTGLTRWGVSKDSNRHLKEVFKQLYVRPRRRAAAGPSAGDIRGRGGRPPAQLRDLLAEVRSNGLFEDPHVRYLVEFLERKLSRGVYGRAREADRTDTRADIRKFYDPVDEDVCA